jgi:glutathione S-transferase
MPAWALYSFRRCPFAIRARLALASAGFVPGAELEIREVSLKAKPPELLVASAKGTVPVLVGLNLVDDPEGPGWVRDESLAIMRWALERSDPQGWLAAWTSADQAVIAALVAQNDGPFKHHLDRFKYPDRFGAEGPADTLRQHHREGALAILREWSARLAGGGWLLGPRPSLADWALLPFVRQFRLADPGGFHRESALEALQQWLVRFLEGPELAAVMAPPWAPRSPWRSPGWLYHLALRTEWQAACAEGVYRRSTRGRSVEDVGFIHLSSAHQVVATAARFYGDLPADALLLLTLDPKRLAAAGLEVRWEQAPPAGEPFPHLYGPLPQQSVLLVEPWLRCADSVAFASVSAGDHPCGDQHGGPAEPRC